MGLHVMSRLEGMMRGPHLADPSAPQLPYLRESLHLLVLQPWAARSGAHCLLPQAGQPRHSFWVNVPHWPGASGSLGLRVLLRLLFSNPPSCWSFGTPWGYVFRFNPLNWSPALPGWQCPWLHGSGVPEPWEGCQLLHDTAKGPQDPDQGTSPSQVEGLARVMPGQTLSSRSFWLHRGYIQRWLSSSSPTKEAAGVRAARAGAGVCELYLLLAVRVHKCVEERECPRGGLEDVQGPPRAALG